MVHETILKDLGHHPKQSVSKWETVKKRGTIPHEFDSSEVRDNHKESTLPSILKKVRDHLKSGVMAYETVVVQYVYGKDARPTRHSGDQSL